MTASLALRLAGPLQSWGQTGRHFRRDTAQQPTKSGVVGLLAAADGRRRYDPIEDLAGLVIAVRVDQAGTLLRDYHTVSDYRGINMPAASGSRPKQARTKVSTRFYLTDAVFVVAIHGDTSLLEHLAHAVTAPHWPLALGRRSCPPTLPLRLNTPSGGALWDGDHLATAAAVPWQAADHHRRITPGKTVSLPVTADDPQGEDLNDDQPVSYDPGRRVYATRPVTHRWVTIATGNIDGKANSHDPLSLLGW